MAEELEYIRDASLGGHSDIAFDEYEDDADAGAGGVGGKVGSSSDSGDVRGKRAKQSVNLPERGE